MAVLASSSGVSRSSLVAIALVRPSSIRRRSNPTMPCAAEQVFRHAAGGEHSLEGTQQPQLALDPGEVLEEGGDPVRGGVVERVEVDQVEAPFGLGGGRVAVALAAFDVGEDPLAGARVNVGAAQQP